MKLDFSPVPACNLCGETAREPLGSFHEHRVEFRFSVCRNCFFVYMDPIMSSSSTSKYYEKYFWQRKTRKINSIFKRLLPTKLYIRLYRDDVELRAGKHDIIYPVIRDFIADTVHLDSESTVLDIGCSWGGTLKHVQSDFDCSVLGVEPSDLTATYAAMTGLKIVARTGETLTPDALGDEQIDLAIMHQCIENMFDPATAVANTARVLKNGGHLFINCRNALYNHHMKVYSNYVFTLKNLTYLLERNGLFIVKLDIAPPPDAIETPDRTVNHMMLIARKDRNLPTPSPISIDFDTAWKLAEKGNEIRKEIS